MYNLLAVAAKSVAIDFSMMGLLPLIFLFIASFTSVFTVRWYLKTKDFKRIIVPFSISLILFTLATVQIGSEGKNILSTFYLLFILGSIGASALLQIFRKTASSLLTISLVLIIVIFFLFLRSITAYTGETKIAEIFVSEKNEQGLTLHITPINQNDTPFPKIVKIKGERFGLIIYQVIFSDLAVFLGAKTRYAWLGITGFDSSFRQKSLLLFPDTLNKKAIFEKIERHELALPFIESAQADISTKIAVENTVYEVFIENDGGTTIKKSKTRVD